jgi:UPF0755 protein
MVDNFNKNLPKKFTEKIKKQGLSFYQGIILASIIQKETYKLDEYPLIASVFYNRLKKRMRLQSDPTVIYGMENYQGNIQKKDLLNKSNVYNTYKHSGLPPTPICNPSKHALDAVINPRQTNYLYFVADKKGGHIFSTNYQDHRKNIRKYLLNKK